MSMNINTNVLRVSEVNRYVRGLIQNDSLLRDIRVGGELSNFKHHHSGHMYFTVKDGSSSLRCVFFRRENRRCPFKPENGMEVILHGAISVYEADGVYQLYVDEMEPAGLGSLYLAYEQLKERLQGEGLFRPELKKRLPLLPRKIGLVTSPTGAALQDILATIRKRYPYIEILVVESLVQGPAAAGDIAAAVRMLNERNDIDLIILARGGGSLEDLWPFNEEAVARAIHGSAIPVISAVGHETDYTIADFAADMRATTPTAAAAAAVPVYEDLLSTVKQLEERLGPALRRRIAGEKQRLDQVVGERFLVRPRERIRSLRAELDQLEEGLRRDMVRLVQLKGLKLSGLIDKLESFSPLKVMNRGYSYCRDRQGRIIRSVKDLEIGSLISLSFRDGRAECRTERIEEDMSIARE